MAKVTNASKTTKAKTKSTVEPRKSNKAMKHDLAKAKKSLQPVKAFTVKTSSPKTKKEGSRRFLNDTKITKLQKMYASKKHSAQTLCDEFGISMATLFNYLKVKV